MRVVRAVVGGLGEFLLTAGVVLILYVVWQLGYVGVVDSNKQAGVVSALEQDFGGTPHGDSTRGSSAGTSVPTFGPPLDASQLQDGSVLGIVRIPRLGGPTWAKPLYQGAGLDVIAKGLGHYDTTQLPGQVGNVAIAGHRTTHGNPFIDIDAIQTGDVMIIETREAWFVYRAVRHEIVEPTRIEVLAPVPGRPGVTPTEAWLTLTSCNPRYQATERYIVFAKFEQKIPHDQVLPAALLADPATKA